MDQHGYITHITIIIIFIVVVIIIIIVTIIIIIIIIVVIIITTIIIIIITIIIIVIFIIIIIIIISFEVGKEMIVLQFDYFQYLNLAKTDDFINNFVNTMLLLLSLS